MTHPVYLVRHGQSEWNVLRLTQGQTSHPRLTSIGREQAERAASLIGQDLAGRPVAHVPATWCAPSRPPRSWARRSGDRWRSRSAGLGGTTGSQSSARSGTLGAGRGSPTVAWAVPAGWRSRSGTSRPPRLVGCS
ncbi:histidine phosphatase family protein [Nocardioides mesophilus]|uniref:Histidine phosphatase family protein n=1 Tax=Nocardioides mesophilus TaxID=433659 RepID=A0A7G9RAN1_9ACTN|nr:histidine phosphatase family protein [Nocardioides mesophilus]